MNSNLIADLEIIRDKLAGLELSQRLSGNFAVVDELIRSREHIERALEWEKTL